MNCASVTDAIKLSQFGASSANSKELGDDLRGHIVHVDSIVTFDRLGDLSAELIKKGALDALFVRVSSNMLGTAMRDREVLRGAWSRTWRQRSASAIFLLSRESRSMPAPKRTSLARPEDSFGLR